MPYTDFSFEPNNTDKFVDGSTKLNKTNLDKLVDNIIANHEDISTAYTNITALSTDKVDKVAGTSGDIVTFGSNGAIADSGKKIETSLTADSDSKVPTSKAVATHVTSAVATKANKVSSTTIDHFVSFSDANGTLKDSGKSASDFSKVEAVTGAASGTALTGLKVDGTSYTIPQGGGSAGVSSIDGATGVISIGGGLTRSGQTINGPDLSGYLTSASAAQTYAQKPSSGSYVVADTDGDISVNGITAADDVVIGTLTIDPTAESAPDYGGNHVSVSTWGNNLALKAFGPQNSTDQGVLSFVSARQDGEKSSRMIFNADGSIIIERSFAQGESDPQHPRFDINGFDVYVNGTQIGGNPCLIAGTKISMADGATKNIEDVKVGDLVKSWNPTTKELCDAVVILSEKTGEENVFTNYIFDDGNNLVIYGDHGYYNPCFRHIRNIQDDKNKDFHVLNQDIKIQQCIVRDKYMHHGNKIGRYNIATSNNLYFANNILCGQSPYAKYNYYIKHSIELPEDIQAVCLADTNDYNEWNSLMNNSAYLKESADARNRRVKSHTAEMAARKELESLDYKTLKHSEGVLTEEEFNQVIVRKEELRAIVNEQHELFMTAYNEVKEIEKKYRTITYDQLFRNCCDRDNEALQLFKNWLQPKGE